LFDVEYTIISKTIRNCRPKTQWVPKAKTPKGKKYSIWPVAFVHSRVKIKIIFWSKLEVLHATETKNVDTWKVVFSIIFYTFSHVK